MSRVEIPNFYLDKKVYDHIKEISIQSHLTIYETIECILHQHMKLPHARIKI